MRISIKKVLASLAVAAPLLFGGVALATNGPSHGDNNQQYGNCQQEDNNNGRSLSTDDKKKKDDDKKKCDDKCKPVVTASVNKTKGHEDNKDCPTPPTDVCSNIDGVQATVPDGYTVADGVCTKVEVPVTPPVDTTPPTVTTTPATTTRTTTATPAEVAPVDNSFQGK